MIQEPITGILLAGGKSARMGSLKAFLELEGKPFIEIIMNKLKRFFPEVMIITNVEDESFNKYSEFVYPDMIRGFGPLSGIHSGLKRSKTNLNFIISSDMPFVSEALISYITGTNRPSEVTIPKDSNGKQFLCGLYHRKCAFIIEDIILAEEITGSHKSVGTLLHKAGAEIIDIERLNFYNPLLLLNINTPMDYEKAKENAKAAL